MIARAAPVKRGGKAEAEKKAAKPKARERFGAVAQHTDWPSASPAAKEPEPESEATESATLEAKRAAPAGSAGEGPDPVGAGRTAPPPKGPATPATAAAGDASRQRVTSLVSATPTELVARFASAGADLSAASAQDEARAQQAAPELKTSLPGGGSAEAGAAAVEAPSPEGRLADGVAPPGAEDAAAGAEPEASVEPTVAERMEEAMRATEEAIGMVEEALRSLFGETLLEVPTESGVETDPGPPPPVRLEGEADPARAVAQAGDADRQIAEGDAAFAASVAQRGPHEVPPAPALDASAALEAAAPPVIADEPLVPGMADYAGMPVTSIERSAGDAILAEGMQADLDAAAVELEGAVAERDAERARVVSDAEAKLAEATARTQSEQDAALAEAQGRVVAGQADARARQAQAVADARAKGEKAQRDVEGQIADRQRSDQERIDQRYAEAEREAEAERRRAEEQAAAEQREADAAKEDESWWDSVKNTVSAAFEAVANAVGKIFDALSAAVGKIIDAARDAALAIVDAAVSFATGLLDALGGLLKGLVTALLGSVFPELAAALNAVIDGAVNWAKEKVAQAGEWLKAKVTELANTVKEGIQKAIALYKTAITTGIKVLGALLTGDFSGALLALLEGALEAAGIEKEQFYAFVGKAEEVLLTIVDDPLGFVGNLVNAIKVGFTQFLDNIWEHLKTGFFEWIVGPLGELGISLPETWDLAGIFGLVLDVLGLNRAGIRSIIVDLAGETGGKIFDFVMNYVDAFLRDGVAGLWEQVKSDVGSLWDMVVEGIKGWLITKIVTKAVVKIATLFNPVGALWQLLETAWNLYTFLVENLSRIWSVVQAVIDGIAQIARGEVGPVANLVEQQLARLIPIGISLLANLLGVGGITKKVRDVLEGVRETIREAIKKLIRRVISMFTGGKQDSTKGAGGVEVGERIPFTGGGERHEVWVEVHGRDAVVMMASDQGRLDEKLERFEGLAKLRSDQDHITELERDEMLDQLNRVRNQLARTDVAGDEIARRVASGSLPPEKIEEADDPLESAQQLLVREIIALLDRLELALSPRPDDPREELLVFLRTESARIMSLGRQQQGSAGPGLVRPATLDEVLSFTPTNRQRGERTRNEREIVQALARERGVREIGLEPTSFAGFMGDAALRPDRPGGPGQLTLLTAGAGQGDASAFYQERGVDITPHGSVRQTHGFFPTAPRSATELRDHPERPSRGQSGATYRQIVGMRKRGQITTAGIHEMLAGRELSGGGDDPARTASFLGVLTAEARRSKAALAFTAGSEQLLEGGLSPRQVFVTSQQGGMRGPINPMARFGGGQNTGDMDHLLRQRQAQRARGEVPGELSRRSIGQLLREIRFIESWLQQDLSVASLSPEEVREKKAMITQQLERTLEMPGGP